MMFGLFGKKKLKPSLTTADKEWVENYLIWFIEVFGFEKRRAQPFILLSKETFPYQNLSEPGELQLLFKQLCNYWDINPEEIELKLFDDIKSKQWMNLAPQGPSNEAVGTYNQRYTLQEKRFLIRLAKSNLENLEMTITILSHELGHVKLLGGKYINNNNPDLERLTDLASIFFGFGLFVANSIVTGDSNWIGRFGYLPEPLISYANALICYSTGSDAERYKPLLNNNTRKLFGQDFEFLSETNDTVLSPGQIAKSEASYELGKQITDGFKTRNFDVVIEASKQLVKDAPNASFAYNNIGYALLQQRKYGDAIEYFTQAATFDPYYDYTFNNRGYCKLQSGDLEDGYTDIISAFEMNPDNSYAWRNLGVYYLATGDFGKALEHLEQAEKIDPGTEMINLYLAHAHLSLGDHDRSKIYRDKSKAMNEYNDSVIVSD